MRKSKVVALSVALLAGAGVIVGLQAYPLPPEGYETYEVYYNNAAHTLQVGVRGVAHDPSCGTWHITWGTVTPYRQVFVEKCPMILR